MVAILSNTHSQRNCPLMPQSPKEKIPSTQSPIGVCFESRGAKRFGSPTLYKRREGFLEFDVLYGGVLTALSRAISLSS